MSPCRLWLLLLGLVSLPGLAEPSVEVSALFVGKALLTIDGRTQLLRAGQTQGEVTLLASDSKSAQVSVAGREYTLTLTKRIAANYQAAEKSEVRLAADSRGHYVTAARINDRPVQVLVDTGATSVVMSLDQARALGLNYRQGRPTAIQTASGVNQAYALMLDSVTVGTVTVRNVEAIVNVSRYPVEILLGNSFLNRVDLSRENGVLVLQAQY